MVFKVVNNLVQGMETSRNYVRNCRRNNLQIDNAPINVKPPRTGLGGLFEIVLIQTALPSAAACTIRVGGWRRGYHPYVYNYLNSLCIHSTA